jgi:hypothetical protein
MLLVLVLLLLLLLLYVLCLRWCEGWLGQPAGHHPWWFISAAAAPQHL